MRHIQIPEPIELANVVDENKNPVKYGLENLNKQNVWTSSKWRDEDKIDMCIRISDKFKESKYKPGAWVSLTDPEFEAYEPLATLKGERINPEMALEVLQIMKPIKSAPHELPGEKSDKKENKPEVKQEN